MTVLICAAADTTFWQVYIDIHIGDGSFGSGVGDGAGDRPTGNEAEVDISHLQLVIGEHERGSIFPIAHTFPILHGVVFRATTEILTTGGIDPEHVIDRQAGNGVVATRVRTPAISLAGITRAEVHVCDAQPSLRIHHPAGERARFGQCEVDVGDFPFRPRAVDFEDVTARHIRLILPELQQIILFIAAPVGTTRIQPERHVRRDASGCVQAIGIRTAADAKLAKLHADVHIWDRITCELARNDTGHAAAYRQFEQNILVRVGAGEENLVCVAPAKFVVPIFWYVVIWSATRPGGYVDFDGRVQREIGECKCAAEIGTCALPRVRAPTRPDLHIGNGVAGNGVGDHAGDDGFGWWSSLDIKAQGLWSFVHPGVIHRPERDGVGTIVRYFKGTCVNLDRSAVNIIVGGINHETGRSRRHKCHSHRIGV